MFSINPAQPAPLLGVRPEVVHDVASAVMTNTLLQCLPAQVNDRCRVLVLGSMPGGASLHEQRYYAHPRNRFWPLMGRLCGFDPALDYPRRLLAVQSCGIGVWDVIGRCQRCGSLDASIVRGSEQPNDLPRLIAALPQLRVIACNGAAAAKAFERWIRPVLPQGTCTVLALPSTSPANAAFDLERLWQSWQQLQPWLQARGEPSTLEPQDNGGQCGDIA